MKLTAVRSKLFIFLFLWSFGSATPTKAAISCTKFFHRCAALAGIGGRGPEIAPAVAAFLDRNPTSRVSILQRGERRVLLVSDSDESNLAMTGDALLELVIEDGKPRGIEAQEDAREENEYLQEIRSLRSFMRLYRGAAIMVMIFAFAEPVLFDRDFFSETHRLVLLGGAGLAGVFEAFRHVVFRTIRAEYGEPLVRALNDRREVARQVGALVQDRLNQTAVDHPVVVVTSELMRVPFEEEFFTRGFGRPVKLR